MNPQRSLGLGRTPLSRNLGEEWGTPGVSGLKPKSWQLWHLLPLLTPQRCLHLIQGQFMGSPACLRVPQADGVEALRGPRAAHGRPEAGREAIMGLGPVLGGMLEPHQLTQTCSSLRDLAVMCSGLLPAVVKN